MLIFDQLKKNDPHLRTVAVVVLAGLGVLLAGLWYVQVISSRRFVEDQIKQSFRTVRFPATRGKILDRNGLPLAENQPNYAINLYLEDLRSSFTFEYTNHLGPFLRDFQQQHPQQKLPAATRLEFQRAARYRAVSNVVMQIGATLQQPLVFDAGRFEQHYTNKLALPLPVIEHLTPVQIARFAEKSAKFAGVELEVETARHYPGKTAAAHLLGHLKKVESAEDDEDVFYNYHLPDFTGEVGVEAAFDKELRGRAGVRSLLVNSLGYRQTDRIVTAPEPGKNLVLTIDLPLQLAAERALQAHSAQTRGAAIVMDVRNGDVLAMASAPAFDPNLFLGRISPEDWEALSDAKLKPQINRATSGIYPPGSIFKIIVALACLEAGELNPADIFHSPGYYQLGRRSIGDTARAGDYDLRRAFLKSSNTYFIHHGLHTGLDKILALGQRFHLGERSDVPTLQDQRGFFPSAGWIQEQRAKGDLWTEGDTANLCIGQGHLAVTPLQMTVMTAAIANGGKIFWPRLVQRLEPPKSAEDPDPVVTFPAGRVRGDLGVQPRNLEIIRAAMRADVEDAEGTGREAEVPGFPVSGKTGTAEVQRGSVTVDRDTWFVSFAPFDSPRYAVVVMVESGGSGGKTCAPVARQIYQAIRDRETPRPKARPTTLADTH